MPPPQPGTQWAPPPPGGSGGGWTPPPPYPGYSAPGYPGGGYGYSGPYPAQPPANEPLSIWSLVLGIVSFVVCPLLAAIPAIITGAKAKKSIDRSGGMKTGRGMAQAGFILGWVNIGLSIVGGVVIGLAVAFFVSHPSYTSLNQGDCFNPSGSFSGRVTKVSCNSAHLNEALGSFELPDGSYPGATGVSTIAGARCNQMAVDYGVPRLPTLQLFWLYPNRNAWDSGTRTVVCSVRNSDGTKRTGSLRSGAGSSAMGPALAAASG
jgi:Domain of unknown function (DUF4190)/Septum formation